MRKKISLAVGFTATVLLSGCITQQPKNITNACSIVQQYPDWYYEAQEVYKKWGVPISVQFAFIYKESSFIADARAPRTKLLGFIPWKYPSTSYGYTQAVDGTWEMYTRGSGNSNAKRDNFEDSLEFIGWYANYIHKVTGVSKRSAYKLYLAYNLGPGAIKNGSYKHNKVAQEKAQIAQDWAWRYASQLKDCKVPTKSWFW